MPETPTPALAIVGMACLFPKADGLAGYWANIKHGVDGITDVPASHWNPDDYHDADPKAPDMTYARRGGFLDPVPFDAATYGISPNALEATDASQLLGLVVATEALKNAGYGAERPWNRDRASVILGVTGTLQLAIPLGARLGHPHWRKALADCGIDPATAEEVVSRIGDAYVPWQENSFPGLLGNVVAGRIANKLDLGGTNCVVDAACASSLSAMHLASLELTSGRSDMVVTGGVDAFNDIFMYMCFSKTPALSPSGNSRPFDQGADGTILGEGLGMVVLKRLEDAERDGDFIWAVIKAIGTSSDGRGKAIYAPSDAGQKKALHNAYALAGVTPETIELVEAHGTGTKVGDATELAGLAEVYGQAAPGAAWCAVGSVKSQIGHTKAAAGAAGLIKAALALHHKVLPPTIKVERPVEQVTDARTPFYLNAKSRPWLSRPEHKRRAAVSAFGFGGSNFHAVLEEHAIAKARPDWDGSIELVALSADSRAELESRLEALAAHETWDALRVAAQASRAAFSAAQQHRLVLVLERDADRLRVTANALAQLREGRAAWSTPDGVFYGEGAVPGQLAVLFPGQGAQYPGMGRDLACLFPQALNVLQAADNAFAAARPRARQHGERLIDHMIPPAAFDEPARAMQADRLRVTDVAQPALGAAGLGAWRVLEAFGVQPAAFAGHSYGELAALCAAGRLAEDELYALSILRGKLMAGDGGDRGAMLAVRADVAAVEQLLAAQRLDVVIANKNAPRQVVLSGETAAIEAARSACQAAGLEATRLQVGAAFHSPLVAEASRGLAEGLEGAPFVAGRVPVYANTTAQPYPDDAAAARTLLAEQLARPVEFVRMIQAMAAAGVHTFVEVAPGARLSGLVRAILEGREHVAIALDASNGKRNGVADLARALAQLAALGHPLDLAPWQGGEDGVRAILERPKPRMAVPISGVNYRTPRPARAPLPPRKPEGTQGAAAASLPAAPSAAAVPVQASSQQVVAAQQPAASASRPAPAVGNGTNGHHVATPAKQNGTALLAQPVPVAMAAHEASQPSFQPAVGGGDDGILIDALKASQEGLVALQRLQEQTARLHHQYLAGQETTQQSFMALLERQQQLFARALGLGGESAASAPAAPVRPVHEGLNGHGAPAIAPQAARPAVHTPPVAKAPAPSAAPVQPAARQAKATPAPQAATPPASANGAIGVAADAAAGALFDVVAEKTGYPTEMLALDMALEADLGIDSIKRVEILSALQERLPGAPVIKPDQLGTLVTLRHVADFLVAPAAAHAPSAATPQPASLPAAPGPASDVAAALLAVVAEKTGYPTEMLGLEMALEADLGIDSIKRVEILSAMQEALPGLPVIQPDQLGTLVTLGDVVRQLAGAPNASVPGETRAVGASPAPQPATVAAAPANPGMAPAAGHVAPAVIAVIADKTGYPPEMLGLDMALEADLGIDSIKRVEILSALQEALPGAPVAKPEHMGTLATVQDLVSFLAASSADMPTAAAVIEPIPPAAVVEPAPAGAAAAPAAHAFEVAARAEAAPIDLIDAITAVPEPTLVVPEIVGAIPTLDPQEDPATEVPNWEPIAGLQRLILRAVPLQASPERAQGKIPFGAEVWVAADGTPLATVLGDRLQALGFKVRTVSVIDESSWPAPGGVAALFLVAGAPDLAGITWDPAQETFLKRSLRLAQHVGPALQAAGTRGGAVLVTVTRLDGAFGLIDLDPAADATSGGLAGLAKTAALEWPEVSCQAIDVDRDWIDTQAIAAEIVAELYLDGPREVGLRPDARLGLDLDETPIVGPAQGLPIRPGELVVVTGGARGVTAETAVALARYARPTLALLGRTPAPGLEPDWLANLEDEPSIKQALLSVAKAAGPLPSPRELELRFRDVMANREIVRTLQRVEAEGAKVVYMQLDIRDEAAVREAIVDLRTRFGPVRGLIHGAGVLADRRIGDLTPEQVDAVLDTKVAGLRHLLSAMGDEPRTIALFSSVTARRGRVGQVAYAMANEALDKVAQQLARKHPHRRIVAINWGPWDGGMVTPALKRMFAEEGVSVVPLDAGAEFLAQELAQPAGAAVEVLVLGAPPRTVTPEPQHQPKMQTAFSRWLTPKQYPFLASHVMNGRAVLPVAMIAEWLGHGALHANPGLLFCGLRELRVFRGVIMDDAPYGIRVAASAARKVNGLHEVVVELRGTGDNDTLHARATALLGSSMPAAPGEAVLWPAAGAYARSPQDAYHQVLFHGAMFQGITAVERCSREGIVADVSPAPAPQAWIQAPLRDTWLADPLALDAAFQLLILWSVQELKAPCLPAFVGEYRQFRSAFPADGVRVVVRVTERRGSQAIADVAFLDAAGALVATMRNAECTVDAGLVDAFRRNALSPSLQP